MTESEPCDSERPRAREFVFPFFSSYILVYSGMSDASSHPNFPLGLDIAPLVFEQDENASFDLCAQKRAIERFGIAGRIW